MSNNLLLNICADLTANIYAISESENKDLIVSNPYIADNNIIWATYIESNNNDIKKIDIKELYSTNVNTIINAMKSNNNIINIDFRKYGIKYSENLNRSSIINRNKYLSNMVMLPLFKKKQEQIFIENIIIDTVNKLNMLKLN